MAQMKYFYELTISSSPHAHSPITTQTIMRDVLIALVPAMIGAVYFFGFRALMVTLVSVAACMFWEWAYCITSDLLESLLHCLHKVSRSHSCFFLQCAYSLRRLVIDSILFWCCLFL
jgi:Na+-transporting NADH:ubiquinone oxidoreductase subunit NqrB